MMRQYGTTPLRSTGDRGGDLWMSSLRDFRASHSATRESNWQAMIRAMDGPPPSESYAKYDRESRGWKTFQVSFTESTVTLTPFSGSWTKQGTMRNGVVFRRRKLERRTKGRGSGSLPTPKVSRSTYDRNPRTGEKVWTLAGMARHGLLERVPTPTVDDADNSTLPPSQIKRDSVVGWVMRNRYPTPQANSWESTGSRAQLHLLVEEGVLTAEEKRKMSAGNGGQLNPEWVEWLMGWVIGWTDLEVLGMDKFREWFEKHGGRYGEG